MNNIANFFWQGTLTLYEQRCLQSFVKNGFIVQVWSYQQLELPKGAFLKDAREILSEDHLTIYSQGDKEGCIAAFSDVFRFTLLNKIGGWWFDTDCFCLKHVSKFIELSNNKQVVAGIESNNPYRIACGVIYFNDNTAELFKKELDIRCLEHKNKFVKWGTIGPLLFTDVILKNNLENHMCSTEYFYPIHFKKVLDFYDTTKTDNLLETTKDSLVCHLWNEILRKRKIDKNVIPKEGTFLKKIFESIDE